MKRSWVLAMALLAMAGSLEAQGRRPNTRSGFWWGLGAGVGIAQTACEGCDDQSTGVAGNLRLGGTLSQNILIGVETNGWYRPDDDQIQAIGFASLIIVIYPTAEGAFYLKGGVGLMNYFAETDLGDLTANAASVSLGAGYEFRIARNFSIVPFLNSLASTEVEFELGGISADSRISMRLFQLGVGVVWH